MRILLIILLLSFKATGQMYFARIASSGTSAPDPGTGTRTLIDHQFNTSFPSDLSVRRTTDVTTTVSGGELRLTGLTNIQTTAIPGVYNRYKSFQTKIVDTGYGVSTIRNYRIDMKFRINSITDSTRGVYVGASCPGADIGYRLSSYAVIDFMNDTLCVIGAQDTMYHPQTIPTRTTGLPAFNTSDNYLLSFIMRESIGRALIKNLTTGDTASVALYYDLNTNAWPLRPPYFNYGFGVFNKTDIYIDYFTVTTDEVLNPDLVFIGTSITTGYSSGTTDSSYAYMLKPYTNRVLQIMAGPGATVLSTITNIPELVAVSPDTVFIELGTNSGGTTADYSRLTDSLTTHGSFVYHILSPNGGNPATGGTWNNYIATTYPSTYIDTWTTGWNTMTIGNGEMYDAVHPTATGMRKLALIIKSALPTLFPL